MQPNPTLCPFQAAYNAPRQAPLCSAQAKAASSATTFKTTRSAPPAKANCDVSFPIRATFARAAAKSAYTKPYAATANAIRRPIPPFGRAPNTPPPSPPCCTHGNTTETFDAVLAMPISRERRLQRGFNQCDSLARTVTQRYKIPLLPPDSVHRAPKPPQSTLSAAERARNIRDAFRVRENVKNCKVVIIDDVSTTHSSIAELSRALLLAGAAEVFACVVACNK